MRIPPHEATTAQLCALYPFVVRQSLPGEGVLVGRDLAGGAFVHDPFELYRHGVLTNPNLLVLGQVGRGKSAFVKSYCFRHVALGRKVVVLDPKGEYGPLAAALGGVRVEVRPGAGLALGEEGADPDGGPRRRDLFAALASSLLGRELLPVEHALLSALIVELLPGVRSLADLVSSLLAPGAELATVLRTPPSALRAEGRVLALALRRLLVGDLAGLFGEGRSRALDWEAPVVVLDLSALYRSEALALAVIYLHGALERLVSAATAQRLLVLDEAWAVFHDLAAARFLQSSLKLARARGVANILVTHRLSDLTSAPQQLLPGLLADCETVVAYAQPEAEISCASAALGLSDSEARALVRLRRGVALWRVAGDPHLVEHQLAPIERSLVDTDGAMRTALVAPPPRSPVLYTEGWRRARSSRGDRELRPR